MIKKGDTLNKIAKKFGLTLDALLAANKKTIKNPNKITVGQEIIIPVPSPTRSPTRALRRRRTRVSPSDTPAP